MHSQYLREIPYTTDVLGTWEWLRKADLKVQNVALLHMAQEQALRTNSVKHHSDKRAKAPCVDCVLTRVRMLIML